MLMGGLVFFLLPFSLWSYQDGLWNSPLVIAFLIIGGLMLIGFALYEKFAVPKTFIIYELPLDRTVLGAVLYQACSSSASIAGTPTSSPSFRWSADRISPTRPTLSTFTALGLASGPLSLVFLSGGPVASSVWRYTSVYL